MDEQLSKNPVINWDSPMTDRGEEVLKDQEYGDAAKVKRRLRIRKQNDKKAGDTSTATTTAVAGPRPGAGPKPQQETRSATTAQLMRALWTAKGPPGPCLPR